jgi:hypothetical protein
MKKAPITSGNGCVGRLVTNNAVVAPPQAPITGIPYRRVKRKPNSPEPKKMVNNQESICSVVKCPVCAA